MQKAAERHWRPKERWTFYRSPSSKSTPFLSDRIELTSHPSLSSLPLIPPLPLFFRSDLLAWFIWWKEFYAGLWRWWYPYTVTFSPRQMFHSQNTVMFIPKSPYKHIKWWLHAYAGRCRQKWQGQWHGCWGLEGGRGGQGGGEQTDRQRCQTYARASWRHTGDLEE